MTSVARVKRTTIMTLTHDFMPSNLSLLKIVLSKNLRVPSAAYIFRGKGIVTATKQKRSINFRNFHWKSK